MNWNELKNNFIESINNKKFNKKVSFYVPSKTKNGSQIKDRKFYVNKVKKEMSKKFGGCTSIEVNGSWVLESGNLQSEKILIVYSYTNKLDKNIKNEFIKLGQSIKEKCEQENVMLEFNNEMILV